jgi:glyoxylase-like metal-dependent hydrolase (beta-lactamase superfamily II)
MEIVDGVHRIETPLGDRFVCLFLLAGDRGGLLIDTGIDSTPREHLLPYLESINYSPDRVRWVLISHADFDHTAGGESVREICPNAEFICHRLDLAMVEDVERLIHDRYWEYSADHGIDDGAEAMEFIRSNSRHTLIDLAVTGGESIRLADDWVVEVLHTPGHTRGHLTVHDPRGKTLIIADASLHNAVRTKDGRPAFPPTYRYVDTYVSSANRLLGMPANLLLTSHYPTYTGPAIAEFLHETLGYVDRVDQALKDEFIRAGAPLTMKQLIESLAPKLGEWPAEAHPQIVFPFQGHLERMVEWGLLDQGRRDELKTYQWKND